MTNKIFLRLLMVFTLLSGLSACKEKKVTLKAFPKAWYLNQPPVIVFENLRESGVKKIVFKIDESVGGGAKVSDTVVLPGRMGLRLGKHEITFVFTFDDGSKQNIKRRFTLFASEPPVKWDYELIAEYPHDTEAFTQGLEFEGDTLYESTGQYGKSSLRKVDFTTGKVIRKYAFDDNVFAEGLTVWNDSIVVLTWQNKKGFVFDKTFNRLGEFAYENSKEGWGLCHNDSLIFKSDGTEKIWILDPETLKEKDYFNVYTHKHKIKRINELEWVEGRIFTNIWMKNALAVIRPETGEVEAVIDLSDLLKKVKKHPALDVLNGIAYHKQRGTIFVTGKNWDKLFEIKVFQTEKTE